ncbi:MAG: respiratory nitrate reductase subunit gamma [candidate division Zixibacteria bacterium]|nr:respiratory nitrate reductase subunit gamma [candidate division Zixibacteria bacterium]
MYDFARGPLVWIAFAIFFGGSVYRIISTIMLAKKDKVILPYMRTKYGLRSIAHWLIPFGSRNMRLRPFFTIMSFLFHACLLLTPIFTLGHIALWQESWGVSWWHLPDTLSTLMTFIVVAGGVVFVLRRLSDPTVRMVTSFGDFVVVLIVIAPFVTGLLAYYQVFDYRTIITIHMWTGAIWLASVPFTKIAHMLFFPLTRAYMGCEFGYVRNARDW